MIARLVSEKKILVCVGPGGVGKTTTAAALATLAARANRRTLVSTIDPAPRLADAFGVALSAEPTCVPERVSVQLNAKSDRLFVARLDTALAFSRLVEEQVSDPAMRRRIFDNPIYRQITSTLTGSQEYAATLALYELVRAARFDVIVLDTPPTAHALDFLDAPHRIAEAVASPALQWFAKPSGGSRFSLQRLRSGGAVVLKRLGRFVGSDFMEDIGAFLADFQVVLTGFLERAQTIEARLRQPDVGFVLVLAPETAAVDEALSFEKKLRESGIPLSAFVVNRIHGRAAQPSAAPVSREVLRQGLRARHELTDFGDDAIEAAAGQLATLARERDILGDAEQREIARLARAQPRIPIVQVPLLPNDVTNLDALRTISEHLASSGNPSPQGDETDARSERVSRSEP